MAYCLIPKIANDFLAKLKSGEIDPEKLNDMTSEERRSFFASFMGEENAHNVNALFESKILLKNQQNGFITWAKQIAGLKPEVQRDIISRINKLDKVLNPAEQKSFLSDLAAQKLGISVTAAEAAKISELAKNVSDAKESLTPENRLIYGAHLRIFQKYMDGLKNESAKTTLSDLKAHPVATPFKVATSTAKEIAGIAKSMETTLNLAQLWRHGLKVAAVDPKIYKNNIAKSFKMLVDKVGPDTAMDAVMADIQSRPNYINGLYQKQKVALGVNEEALPSTLQEKIPLGIGNIFKRFDNSFKAFQRLSRADLFDKFYDMAQKSGADTSQIGKVVNSLTDRGDLGTMGEKGADVINLAFFSPRFAKSNIDALTGFSPYYGGMVGKAAKIQAAMQSVRIISLLAGVSAIAKAIAPENVSVNPIRSGFAKIQSGNARTDLLGPLGPYIQLAAREVMGETEEKGKIIPLEKSHAGGRAGLFWNFMQNRESPAITFVRNLQGKDVHTGEKITPFQDLAQIFTPIVVKDAMDYYHDPNLSSGQVLVYLLGDFFGINTRDYTKRKSANAGLYR